jgi:RNA polymerase sigma-70 factor (ECF subfamily)
MRSAEFKAVPLPDDDLVRVAGAVEPRVPEMSALARCLHALESRAQDVLMMTYREDLAAAEVATRLDTTAGNVRVLRHRALASLRRCLDGSSA